MTSPLIWGRSSYEQTSPDIANENPDWKNEFVAEIKDELERIGCGSDETDSGGPVGSQRRPDATKTQNPKQNL